MPATCPTPLYQVEGSLGARIARLFGAGVACRRRRRARGIDPVGERGLEIVAPVECGNKVCSAGWVLVARGRVYAGIALLLDRGKSQVVTPVYYRVYPSLEAVLGSRIGKKVQGCMKELSPPVAVPATLLPPGTRVEYAGASYAVLVVRTWEAPPGVVERVGRVLGPPAYRYRNHMGETRAHSLLGGVCRLGAPLPRVLAALGGDGRRSAHRRALAPGP